MLKPLTIGTSRKAFTIADPTLNVPDGWKSSSVSAGSPGAPGSGAWDGRFSPLLSSLRNWSRDIVVGVVIDPGALVREFAFDPEPAEIISRHQADIDRVIPTGREDIVIK